MKRLPDDAQRLLDAARAAAGPTAEQRARADAAVRARLARYGVHDLPVLDASGTTGLAQGTGGAVGLGLKLGAAALVVAVALGVVMRGRSTPQVAPPEAAPSSAVPSAPPALPAEAPPVVTAPSVTVASQFDTAHKPRVRTARPSDAGLQAELQLIGEANALLQSRRYDAALRVLGKHGHRFPRGVLRAERDGLRVLALCGLGSTERALRERERYLAGAPHSPLLARVRAACAEGEGHAP